MMTPSTDPQALVIARQIHRMAGADQTILFGSRARGDYRHNSDIDVLVIKNRPPEKTWLEDLRQRARHIQKAQMPQASGIDVLCMTEAEFLRDSHLRNNLANSIAKHGCRIMPDEQPNHRDHQNERTDWQDVRDRLKDATDAAGDLGLALEAGYISRMSDKGVGRAGQTALENIYKAVLGASGFVYPSGGRDGHNLRLLVEQMRRDLPWPDDQPVPGEQHQYLTEFGGSALYAHEHTALDKERIAIDIAAAVSELGALVESMIAD